MASSHRCTSYRTADFKKRQDALPDNISQLAQAKFGLFCEDRYAPSLQNHQLQGPFRAITISWGYRAIYRPGNREQDDDSVVVWVWIGSHEAYNNYIARLR